MTTAEQMSDEDFAQACHDSPTFFAREVLGMEPTPQQMELLEAIAPPGAKVAAGAGHGVGKSTALSVSALWFLATRENAKIPCTAPTGHQLEDVLWSEIRSLCDRMTPYMRSQFHIKADKITMDGSAGYIVARTARPENPDALQGFHAENILFIIDEAAGVHDKVFEVARGALSTPNARVIMTANPTQLTGYFYNAFHVAKDTWTRLRFSCLDSPLVDPGYAKEIAQEYGEDSDMYRVRVLGEFPRHGLLSMVSADDVEKALNRLVSVLDMDYAPVILGVDPAWMGSDRSVIALRQGLTASILMVDRGLRGDALGNRVIHYQDKHNAAATFVDQTGVGASCCDFLRGLGRNYTPVAFGGAAIEPTRFLNRRAEMWWKMREWFQGEVALALHPDLVDDLTGPEYSINSAGKIQLESKDSMRSRGLHSPDLGDALALTFAAPVTAVAQIRRNTFSDNYDKFRILNKKAAIRRRK